MCIRLKCLIQGNGITLLCMSVKFNPLKPHVYLMSMFALAFKIKSSGTLTPLIASWLLMCLKRSLHSLVSELFLFKTHRQQWMFIAAFWVKSKHLLLIWCQTKCVPMIPASCKSIDFSIEHAQNVVPNFCRNRAETYHEVRLPEDDGHLLWHPSGYSQRSMVLVSLNSPTALNVHCEHQEVERTVSSHQFLGSMTTIHIKTLCLSVPHLSVSIQTT